MGSGMLASSLGQSQGISAAADERSRQLAEQEMWNKQLAQKQAEADRNLAGTISQIQPVGDIQRGEAQYIPHATRVSDAVMSSATGGDQSLNQQAQQAAAQDTIRRGRLAALGSAQRDSTRNLQNAAQITNNAKVENGYLQRMAARDAEDYDAQIARAGMKGEGLRTIGSLQTGIGAPLLLAGASQAGHDQGQLDRSNRISQQQTRQNLGYRLSPMTD